MFKNLMQKLRGGGGGGDAVEAGPPETMLEERLEAGTTGPPGIMPDGDVPDWTADEGAPPSEEDRV